MKYLALAVGFSLSLVSAATSHARDVTDATQVKVSVPEQARRIVTLAPSLGELVAEILQLDLERIVGVSDRTDYPPVLLNRPSVGAFVSFNIEKVMGLKPDLVFATTDGNPKDRVDQLRSLGVPVVVVRNSTVQQIEESFDLVAEALGRQKVGKDLKASLQKGIKRIRGSVPKGTHPRVLLQIGTEPLVVAGKTSFLNEALEIVGARNAYDDLKANYPKPTLEDVIQRRPDWILVVGMDSDLTEARKMAADWNKVPFPSGRAPTKVAIVAGDTLLRPSLRLLDGLTLLRDAIYRKQP